MIPDPILPQNSRLRVTLNLIQNYVQKNCFYQWVIQLFLFNLVDTNEVS